jgi:hypothetical protein
MPLRPTYPLDSIVYHVASDATKGIVTGHLHRRNCLAYGVTWGDERAETWHWESELTDERPLDLDGVPVSATRD